MKTNTHMHEKLQQAARKARENAYAPYSKFKIGAAILSTNGNIYSGCNVENAAYPEGVCAESSAIAAMVNGGDRSIKDIYITGSGAELVPPCGGCRQKIREFSAGSKENTYIYIHTDKGAHIRYRIDELLPHSFGREFLESTS